MGQEMITEGSKTLAIDFDGTIVEHAFPKIGKEMLFAFDTMKALQKKGHKLVLWTFREGHLLEEAVQYCREKGVEFYAVNKSYPEEQFDLSISRKIHADVFVDDRNIGGFIGWSQVWQTLHPEGRNYNHQLKNPDAHHNQEKKGGSLFSRIFKK